MDVLIPYFLSALDPHMTTSLRGLTLSRSDSAQASQPHEAEQWPPWAPCATHLHHPPRHLLSALVHDEATSIPQMNSYIPPTILHTVARLIF